MGKYNKTHTGGWDAKGMSGFVRFISGYYWVYSQSPARPLLPLCHPLFSRLLPWGLITAIWRMCANQFQLLIEGTLLIRKGYGTNNNRQVWGLFLNGTPFIQWLLSWINLSLDFLNRRQTLRIIMHVDTTAHLKLLGIFLKAPTAEAMWLFKSLIFH